jgi:hypothetical protein
VVARRIFDNLMPGWQQIGAVWLPLPHVLNMFPVQVDAWYRNGASGIAISVLAMACATWSLSRFLIQRTGSIAAATAGAVVMLANPNILYVQSTPMTEPLLFGTVLASIALTADWLDRGATGAPHAAGFALVAACMTRYEAWPICGAIVGLAAIVLLRRGVPVAATLLACGRLAAYPAVAVLLFLANSRWTVGQWFVSGGFFVAENEALGQPNLAWEQVREGLDTLGGTNARWMAIAGTALAIWAFVRSRAHASIVLVLATAASAVLPWYAYLQGHPFRIRYSLPLVVACAALTATGISLLHRRARLLVAVAASAAMLLEVSPLDRSAPLIVESQRDVVNKQQRQSVTDYLRTHHDGSTIMMSMGSLAHYMHDLSFEGFTIHDFLHEGNGEVWVAAMQYGPRGYVRWVAIEEAAEGGDALFLRAKQFHAFLEGFERVAEGGGVALYRDASREKEKGKR